MTKVLLIKANEGLAEQTFSSQLLERFKTVYQEIHSDDEIEELDLYQEYLPYYSGTMIRGMEKLRRGYELNAEEMCGAQIVKKYLDQFAAADTVVLTFPMWNFSIPAILKNYIDYLAQAGTAFIYTKEGPKGLFGEKKAAILHTRGDVYSRGPAMQHEMAVSYVKNMFAMFGIMNVSTVIIEGYKRSAADLQALLQAGLQQADRLARDL